MIDLLLLKCTKDNEGFWTEGEIYPACVLTGTWVMVGDDDEPDGAGWAVTPMEYRKDGTTVYQVVGLDGEVLFEEAAQ